MIAALVLAAAIAVPDRPKDFVTDTTGTLRSSTVSSLNSELNSYYSATGNTIFVYIAQSTGDVPLEDWTVQTATKWKVGRKGKDDGAILFVFMRDHKMRIEVGYGLEQSLTDASSSEIIRNTITPKMRAGDPDAAVQNGVDAMLLTITPSYASKLGHAPPAPSSETSDSSGSDSAALALIIFIIVLGVISIIIASRKGRRGVWYMGSGLAGGGFGGGGFGGGGGGGFSGGFGGGFGGGGASGGW